MARSSDQVPSPTSAVPSTFTAPSSDKTMPSRVPSPSTCVKPSRALTFRNAERRADGKISDTVGGTAPNASSRGFRRPPGTATSSRNAARSNVAVNPAAASAASERSPLASRFAIRPSNTSRRSIGVNSSSSGGASTATAPVAETRTMSISPRGRPSRVHGTASNTCPADNRSDISPGVAICAIAGAAIAAMQNTISVATW